MGSEWQHLKLSEVAVFSYGKMPKKGKIGTGVYPTYSGYKYQYLYPEYNCDEGDLIVVARGVGGTGDVKLVNKRCYLTNLSIKINLDQSKIDNRYFYYFYLGAGLRHLDSGSAQSQITINDLGNVVLSVPPLQAQIKVVEILERLDNKIALNRQINTTLESMAQALFKSWFVDFDPVIDNALAAGNEIPDELAARAARREALRQQTNKTANETSNKTPAATDSAGVEQALPDTGLSDQRLPTEIQQLFPDRFVLTEEMGWVPEGWEVALSGDLIDVRDGTHDSPKKSEVGYPLVTSKHITSGRLELANTYLISEKDYDDVNKRSKVETGDILLTMIGTVGIPYLVMEEKINFAIKNIGLFRTSASPEFKYYFFLLLGTHGMQTYLDARMAGTTQKYLSLKVLRNLELIKPARNVLQVFNSIVDSWFQRKTQTEKSSATLADLRDSLLPKLLSGQITIPDAEQQLAEVL